MIADDPFWIELTVLRSYTAHTYNEQLADHVYNRLPQVLHRFQTLISATEPGRDL